MRVLRIFAGTTVILTVLSCAGDDHKLADVAPVLTEEDLREVEAVAEPKDIKQPEEPGGENTDVTYPLIPGDLVIDPYWLESDDLPTLSVAPGCTDPLASNYDSSVAPEGEDGSCQYDNYTVPSPDNTKKTYRNVFAEAFTASWCPECIVPNRAMELAKDNLRKYNEDHNSEHQIVDVYTHVSGVLRDPLSNSVGERRVRDFSVSADALPFIFFNQVDDPSHYLTVGKVSRVMHNDINLRVRNGIGAPHLVDIALTSDFDNQQLEGFFSLKIRTGNDLPAKRRINYTLFLVEDEVAGPQRNVAAGNREFSPQYDDLVGRAQEISGYEHPYVLRREIMSGNTEAVKFLSGEVVFTRKFVYDDTSVALINSGRTEHFHLVLLCYDNDRLWVWNVARVRINDTITW